MRHGSLVLIIAGVSLVISANAISQCVTVQGDNGQITGSSIIVDNVSYPDDSVLQQGAAAWNSTSCNTTGIAFPSFQFGSSPSGQSRFITVTYDPGPANGVCAITGGTNITMYGSATLASDPSRVVDCNTVAAENFEHELGHILGLDDSSCSGYIMDTNRVDSQGNFNSRSIQPDECNAAANKWVTLDEVATTDPPPPKVARDPNDPGNGWDDRYSPIVVNFDTGGYRLTGANSPVSFDMPGNGHPTLMGWTSEGPDEAFLWLDRNGNGRVTSGAELFGNFTPLRNGDLAKNGFEALREFDGNNDGVIDVRDPIWPQLMLWRDLNHNGLSEPAEIAPLAGSGVIGIDVHYHWTGRQDRWGNVFRYESFVSMANRSGSGVYEQPVYDIFFVSVHR